MFFFPSNLKKKINHSLEHLIKIKVSKQPGIYAFIQTWFQQKKKKKINRTFFNTGRIECVGT